MKKMKVGVVGAGLQAGRRIPSIVSHPLTEVVGIASFEDDKLHKLANTFGLKIYSNWEEMVNDSSIDLLVVTTYPDTHAQICIEAVKKGKHVLCEKPLAKTVEEAVAMEKTARLTRRIIKCGFNHRFHPAISEAKSIIDKGQIGGLLFGRGLYGYCGRPGFEKEWRSNKKYSAGGIMMEQGIHLVDLFRWFLGEIKSAIGISETSYWPIRPFDDNTMAILKTKNHQPITIQSSNLLWKNTFQFEVYGTLGYVKIEGLGASYGVEKLIFLKKDYTGPFKEQISEYRGGDISWKNEWNEFIDAIKDKRKPCGDVKDGVEAMKIVEAIYESSKKGLMVNL